MSGLRNPQRQVMSPFMSSPAWYKSVIGAAVQRLSLQEYKTAFENGTATGLKSLALSPSLPGRVRLGLHGLRLGYLGISAVLGQEPDPCAHYLTTSDMPLLHYLLDFPVTGRLRQPLGQRLPLQHDPASSTALVDSIPPRLLLSTFLQYFPPR